MKHTLSLITAIALLGLLCGCHSKHEAQSTAPKAANKVLYDYLGEPVALPANLDAAYTKEGLTNGIQAAAQAAGVSLVKLEIEDSEFPFLVGVVCANRDDRQKLEAQIRKLPAYNYTGGWGGNNMRAMDLVPLDQCPAEARQRIDRRLRLREQILGEKISGRP